MTSDKERCKMPDNPFKDQKWLSVTAGLVVLIIAGIVVYVRL